MKFHQLISQIGNEYLLLPSKIIQLIVFNKLLCTAGSHNVFFKNKID